MRICLSQFIDAPTEPSQVLSDVKAWGYDGVLVAAPHGVVDVGAANQWKERSGELRRLASGLGLAIAGVHAGRSVHPTFSKARADELERVHGALQLAESLGAELVILTAPRLDAWRLRTHALEQNAEALRRLAREAVGLRVLLAFENGGDLPASTDAWFVADSVGLPNLRACLNVAAAVRARESISLALPRMGAVLAAVHLAVRPGDDDDAVAWEGLAGGAVDIARLVDVLKGMAFRGWLVVSSSPAISTAARAHVALAAAAALRAELAKPVGELSAYKGDKHAPRFAVVTASDTSKAAT
ncbi:MAG: sugar phosphate isomerase/epimerase [Phycisphaerae bacterium]|jgi:sugar phosphate isomerase/epimerase|nr:sugar phosphate isomerase/epimerase [Phycisphaerae bacterium]MCZ2400806.1 sugar phosphate isomerase/epimerase [Phycisphaerae bacterium]NUQ48402.1 sugar phosphate isomerase/epimerase [Phycisphaerae bacterium]